MKKKPEKPAQGRSRKPVVALILGSPEYKAYLKRLAEFDRETIAGLFDRAIRVYAKHVGFEEPIPKR